MKCLLLAPKRYPFVRSIEKGIQENGIELKTVDYVDFFSDKVNAFRNRFAGLPKKMKSLWEGPYEGKVNEAYLTILRQFQPDLVLIYNNQLIQPDTLDVFRKKARVAFLLGDNPLYTPTNIYNLHILFKADYIICPDTRWKQQLETMGIKNVYFDSIGFDSEKYFPMDVDADDWQQYQSDLIYVGSSSKTNWGYKRALFLSLFRDFNLKAYISGGGLATWTHLFPGLQEKIILHDRFDAGFNNLVYNCSKIAPVELVPSLFNGIHVRVFDVLGAGILPLCEYSSDLKMIFSGIDIPLISNYGEAGEMTSYWLKNEEKRIACIREMRERVTARFSPEKVIRRMMERVFHAENHANVN